MNKLYDISFWPFFDADLKDDIEFQKTYGYIADVYQTNLNGYKPYKTTRIGIYLSEKEIWNSKPWVNGSIVHLPAIFDAVNYQKLSAKDAKLYLLNLMHSTIMKYCKELQWENSKFENAYLNALENNLEYIKEYPSKTSRNKQNTGQVKVRKTLERTMVFFVINNHEIKVYEKDNEFWMDPFHEFASKNKWFDNDTFGISASADEFRLFYSLSTNRLAYRIDPKYGDEDNLKKRFKRIIDQITPAIKGVFKVD